MAQAGRTVPSEGPVTDPRSAFLCPADLASAPPQGLRAVDLALARGLASVGAALSALDRAASLLEEQRRLLEPIADARATAAERVAAMRGFGAARLRLAAVCDGVALLDGSLPRGLRVITGLDGGAIMVAPVELRPAFAAIAEAPSARVAAAMLSPDGAIAEAARAVAAAQRRLAADQRRLRNRQSLNAALARAWGDGAPPPRLIDRLFALFRPRATPR